MKNKKNSDRLNLNGWSLGKALGKGGNGEVREVTKNGKSGALKFPHPNSKKLRLIRFKDEVQAMRKCSDITGVLPIYDECLEGSNPWFIMALATPIRDALKDNTQLGGIVSAMCGIAKVLEDMHARGVTHRDIKPENLFKFNDNWSVGDFGLATFEGKESKTIVGEKIGPIHYIAPEMLNSADKSRGEPADVFSLAKTLWVLATGQHFALPGSYDSRINVFRIGSYLNAERTGQLDKLIEACTAVIPEKRPTMQSVRNELTAWLNPVNIKEEYPVKIEIGIYAAKMDNAQNEFDAKNAREHEQYLIREKVNARTINFFGPFFKELKRSLEAQNFKNIEYSDDRGLSLVAFIVSLDQSSHRFSLKLSVSLSGVNVKVSLVAKFERGSEYFSRLVLWKKDIEFVEGSSAEINQMSLLLDSISHQISSLINMALQISFGPSEELIQRNTLLRSEIKVIDENDKPVSGATVVIIRNDGLHEIGSSGSNGILSLFPYPPANPFAVFVAHEDFKAKAVPIQSPSTQVILEREENTGSIFACTGWFSIPHVGHGIDFKIDNSERMYFYTSNDISINGGVAQPFHIEIGGVASLKNISNQEVEIELSAAHGKCLLINVRKIRCV